MYNHPITKKRERTARFVPFRFSFYSQTLFCHRQQVFPRRLHVLPVRILDVLRHVRRKTFYLKAEIALIATARQCGHNFVPFDISQKRSAMLILQSHVVMHMRHFDSTSEIVQARNLIGID